MRIRQTKTDSMSNKQIGINMVAQIISFSSNLLISFVLTPFLINNLGKETYSFYPIVNTFIMYMSIVTGALNTMASRFVTISILKGETGEAEKYFADDDARKCKPTSYAKAKGAWTGDNGCGFWWLGE